MFMQKISLKKIKDFISPRLIGVCRDVMGVAGTLVFPLPVIVGFVLFTHYVESTKDKKSPLRFPKFKELKENIEKGDEKSIKNAKELMRALAEDKDFQSTIEKLLTANYKNIEDFEKEIKEIFGTETSDEAYRLFLQLKDFIYDQENLKLLSEVLGLKEKQDEIIAEFDKRQKILEDNLREFGKKYIALDQGFIKLTPLYFEGRKVKKNPWTDKFRLVHIKEGCDVIRKITKDIENAIESKENILLLGESGSGKTLILYRIIMDYYNKGYNVLFKEGSETFEKPTKVIDLIKEYADTKEVLIAVDNVHLDKNIRAFEIIDELRDLEEDKNIVCVFAARQPELNDLLTKDLLKKDFELVDTITKLRKETCEFKICNLDSEEAVLFVSKYFESKNEQLSQDQIKEKAKRICKKSKKPLLFKYFLTGNGIERDILDKYGYVQGDKVKEDLLLFTCLLDATEVEIKEDYYKCLGYDEEKIDTALDDMDGHGIIYDEHRKTYSTEHSEWAIYYLKDLHKKQKKRAIIKLIKKAENFTEKIFDLENEELAYNFVVGLSRVLVYEKNLKDFLESSLKVPEFLSKDKKAELYTLYVAWFYYELKKI